jgi:hypothetical protein
VSRLTMPDAVSRVGSSKFTTSACAGAALIKTSAAAEKTLHDDATSQWPCHTCLPCKRPSTGTFAAYNKLTSALQPLMRRSQQGTPAAVALAEPGTVPICTDVTDMTITNMVLNV